MSNQQTREESGGKELESEPLVVSKEAYLNNLYGFMPFLSSYQFSILQGLTSREVEEIEHIAMEQKFEAGKTIIHEGELSTDLYLILKGKVEILKVEKGTSFRLATFEEGDIFGEMSFLDQYPRASTVKTLEPSTLLCLQKPTLQKIHQAAYRKLLNNLMKLTATRLRQLNEYYAQSLQAQLVQLCKQYKFGYFFIMVIIILTIPYLFDLLAIQFNISISSPRFSWIHLLSIAIPVCYLIKQLDYPLNYFGITLKDWKQAVTEGLIIGIGGGIIIIATYGVYIYILFQKSILSDLYHYRPQPIRLLIYFIHAYTQEFISRGVLQSSLKNFLNDSKGLLSIFLTSLLFAVKHTHLGEELVLSTFIVSLIFGWIYLRRENLLEVTIVHFIWGILAKFLFQLWKDF